MSKKKRNKYSRNLTIQQRALGFINKIESTIRAIRKKVQDGHWGTGNNFDIEEFAAAMDELGEVVFELEYIGEDLP